MTQAAMDRDSGTAHRRRVILVLGICALALTVRLSFLSSWASTPLFHSLLGDEQNFHNTALSLLGARPSDGPFLYQPLYSFFLASVYWLFGVSSSLVRIIQLLLGVMGVWLAYRLAKRMGGIAVGYTSAILMALYGPLVFFEGHLLAPGLVVFLLTGALLFLLESSRPGRAWLLVISGLFMGLAMMGRPNLALILPLALIWLLVKSHSWKDRMVRSGLALVGLVLGLSPSSVYNAIHAHSLVPVSTAGGISFYIGNNPHATGRYHIPRGQGIDPSTHESYSRSLTQVAEQAEGRQLNQSQVSAYWYGRGLDFWRRESWAAIGLFGKKLLMAFGSQEQAIHNPYELGCELAPVLRPLLTFGVLFPFFVLGLFWSVRRLYAAWVLAAGVGLYALSMALFYVADRYRLAMLPMMLPLAAAGMVDLARRFKDGGLRSVWVGLVIIGLSFGFTQITRASDYERAKILSAGYNRLGTAAARMGKLREAQKAYSRAVSLLGPRARVGSMMNLAMTYFEMREYAQAAKWFERVTRSFPSNASAVVKRAQCAEHMGRLQDAIHWWKKAAGLVDDPGPVLKHLEELEILKNENPQNEER